MEKFVSKKGVSVYAYKGDAMTLLAFDLDQALTENFVGFTIKVLANNRAFYIYNRMKFGKHIQHPKKPKSDAAAKSTLYSPIQKFRWIHVPSTIHYIDNPYFGEYTYEVTPRYIENGTLLALDKELTVTVAIDVSPFKDGNISVGFTRSFISSQAFAYHFGNKLNLRPNAKDLTFDTKAIAGTANRFNPTTGLSEEKSFTYNEIHEYLGWQARDRVMEFLDEVLNDNTLKLDVFAYDLNEPVIVDKLLELAAQGRVRIILDDYPGHKKADSYEMKFDAAFVAAAQNRDDLFRGHFGSQAHSKVFIQRRNTTSAKAEKVLTGSTNFTTNGLYINANHTLTFNSPEVAQVYADAFDASFGETEMKAFKNSDMAFTDFEVSLPDLPEMTLRFSPHPEEYVDYLFKLVETRILEAESDVLFAIMMDESNSDILSAVRTQVESDQIFTAGITDVRKGMQLYKPGRRTGIRLSGLSIATKLPKPFKDIINVPGLGHVIHHKFIVVDFKGADPVVYCGSSNLAYNPEQANGDNLLEIRDKDVVTAFAIEAIRLVDHFAWLNRLIAEGVNEDELFLKDNSESTKWYTKYYNEDDLRYLERTLLMK